MVLNQSLAAYELLSRADVSGGLVAELLGSHGVSDVQVEHVQTYKAATDFVKVRVCGSTGPTLGVIGRLGGAGAFYDPAEREIILQRYGPLDRLQKL